MLAGRPTNHVRLPGRVLTLAPSRDGSLWVSTGEDLRRCAPGEPGKLPVVRRLDFGNYGVTTMHEDRAGGLWIGTSRQGLFRLEGTSLSRIAGVHHAVMQILDDAEGNLWVATDGAGVFRVRPAWFHLHGEAQGLPRETVVSVCEDWVAPRGGGLGRLDSPGKVEMLPEHATTSVAAVLEDGEGGVWLGTAGGRLLHRGPARAVDLTLPVSGAQARVLHRDRTGDLWVGCFPFGLFLLPAQDRERLRNLEQRGFPRVPVTAMAEDAGGAVWIGTGTGELFCHTNGAFRRFGAEAGFPGFSIGALLPSTNGGLWVGTLGGGLGRFQVGRVKFLGQADGLADDVVSQLVADDAGWLWLGSSRGLSRLRPGDAEAVLAGRKERLLLTHYGQSDGLANLQCTAGSQPSVWRTRAGWLRFATSQGVVSFDPAALPMNLRPPPLVLERVSVDGVPVELRPEVRLPHDFKKLEFDYTALSFVAAQKVRFRRQLVGFDESWIEDGSARTATYPRLPPGSYRFQFTACNNDGVWNDEVCWLRFEVVPAFWQTVWFGAVAVLGFAGLVAGGVLLGARARLRRKLARLEAANALERERSRISRDLHDDLGARLTQMALQTDLAADDPAAPAELQTQMKEVSTQARSAVQSLDETVWMINPQKDTLAHVVGYLAHFAEQFFQRTAIRCRLDIARELPDCAMPGTLRRDILLLVKEALNNAQKHAAASEVRLRVAVRGRVLRISVRDNGRGFPPDRAKPQRHGLGNMRERAGAAGIQAVIRSQPGRGTLVALSVRLPLPRARGSAGSA